MLPAIKRLADRNGTNTEGSRERVLPGCALGEMADEVTVHPTTPQLLGVRVERTRGFAQRVLAGATHIAGPLMMLRVAVVDLLASISPSSSSSPAAAAVAAAEKAGVRISFSECLFSD